MINQIDIKNFKSVFEVQLECANLTLLSGANGSGKSTILQTLLVLLQSSIEPEQINLSLNGAYIQLGTAFDIEYEWSTEDSTSIEITYLVEGHAPAKIEFKVDFNDTRDVISIPTQDASTLFSFVKNLKYLSASRISPSHIFPYSTNEIETRKNLGIHGEFSIGYLKKNGDKPIPVLGMCHPNQKQHGIEDSLLANVNAWMQLISPGVQISPSIEQDIAASKVKYGYHGLAQSLSSHNVGFGITYVLPVVTRILMSEKTDILILENPEAHVHPRGQVELGRLIATAAENGIQIFLETHSDHIFNGIRLQLKQSENAESNIKNCAMYYVDRKRTERGFMSTFERIELSKDARIKKAPVGFFDEWEASIMELL